MEDWEKGLSPLAKSRLARLGGLSDEDRQRMKETEELDALLEGFFRDELDVGGLWESLRGLQDQGRQHLLRHAYERLRGSFKWKGLPIAFEEGSDGTLTLGFREQAEAEELGAVIELGDDNFDEAVRSYPLLVVDCWAEWCGPCRVTGPVIEELAEAYRGRITFGKLDVDRNRAVPMKYQVMSIPTLLVFKNGQLVDTKVGALPKQVLESELTKHL